MNSLEDLKKKLQRLQHKTETDTTQTETFDFTDPKKWLKGNTPADWLELINHVKLNVTFPNSYQKHNVLSELFEQAFKEFEPRANKNNEAYAHLFVQYARLKSNHLAEDASVLFNQARAISRKYAIVHIASAQFELERDDIDKARKILQKALILEAEPVADVQAALDNLQKGAKNVYTSPQSWPDQPALVGRNLSSGSESTDTMERLSNNLSFSMPPPAEPVMQTTEHSLITSSLIKKPGMTRKYNSESALDSVKNNNRVKTCLPGRVKKINLPFQMMLDENEEEVHNTTLDSFKPIDHTKNHTTNGTSGLNHHGHTSGYLSMTSNTCDSTIPMEKAPTEDWVEKKPEMPKPVEKKVQEQPRKPLAPKQLEPETPNNKQVPSVPSTPMPQLKMITVNDQYYAIIGIHGKGGSSEVYRCLDSSNKIVAIKCVHLDNTHEKIIEGYKNEIQLLKRLQYCDQVITMYDSEFKSDENKLYVVMESGSEDLASFFRCQMKNKKRLSENLICYYWEIMLEAVQALHKEGIIHSDLKPANFLLVGGKLKLIDFGIAKTLQQDKTSVILDTQIGTLNYMSPETIVDCCGGDEGQKKKFKIGVKSDVWSLGCILYNLVYMRTPFQHLRQDFLKVQAITNPDFPIEFPDLPNKHLIDVLKKCLTRDPKGRPSVDELLSHPYLGKVSLKTNSPQVVKPS